MPCYSVTGENKVQYVDEISRYWTDTLVFFKNSAMMNTTIIQEQSNSREQAFHYMPLYALMCTSVHVSLCIHAYTWFVNKDKLRSKLGSIQITFTYIILACAWRVVNAKTVRKLRLAHCVAAQNGFSFSSVGAEVWYIRLSPSQITGQHTTVLGTV